MWQNKYVLFLCLLRSCCVHGFAASSSLPSPPKSQEAPAPTTASSAVTTRGFGVTESPLPKPPSSRQLKQELVDLISRMTGSNPEELQRVEDLINTLESRYTPPATLGFFNTYNSGSWQLLFTTKSKSSPPHPMQFRLRELVQTVSPGKGLAGNVTTTATWDIAENEPGQFETTGTFAIEMPYTMPVGGARMVFAPPQHTLRILSGPLPKDPSETVGKLFRSVPSTLFDASDHGVDTTYMDADMRMVRYTGALHEGVRDIFMRVGSMEVRTQR